MKKQRNMDAFAPSNLWQLIRLHQFLTEKHPLTNNKQQTSMKRLIQFKQLRSVPKLFGRSEILIALLLFCLALLPKVQALSPVPDGGYPAGNTAEGRAALFSLTSGTYNTAVGFLSLRTNTEGNFNTATGAGTLLLNTGNENTATGAGALLSNTTGIQNTANGAFALFSNTTGGANTANGHSALFNNTTGFFNTANGDAALGSNTTGSNNTAIGDIALFSNTEGNSNTAMGSEALVENTTGFQNTALGADALESNTTGQDNTAAGAEALINNTNGIENSAFGVQALWSNLTGQGNTASGAFALYDNTEGSANTAVGANALSANTTGTSNIALGLFAGGSITTANNVIAIGNQGANVSDTTWIGNIYGIGTQSGITLPVLVSNGGQLGTASSSRRFKKDIEPMDTASESILALKPVTFHYKTDNTNTSQFGLIAEEVAEVNPDLVVHDKNGEIYTVRYDVVNAMLLNEYLKAHRKAQQQDATITQLNSTIGQQRKDFETTTAQQQKEIQALTASLKEQASQIQKVSAQLAAASPSRGGLELKNTAPQVVLNNQ